MAWWIQLSDDDMEPPFTEIALIAIPYEAFAKRFSISFTENTQFEAPGPMAYATIEVESGTQFALHHFYDHQELGVWALAHPDGNHDRQRAELAAALNLA